jgi:hypothetical protein
MLSKSQTINVTITSDAVEMVAFLLMSDGTILKKYAYPSRASYVDISKSANEFTFRIDESVTAQAPTGVLLLDVKAWDANGNSLVKRVEITRMVDTAIKVVLWIETTTA